MSVYYVQGSDGRFYGPGDLQTLNEWAMEGRILAQTVLIEQGTNRQVLARDVPGLQHHYSLAPRPGALPPAVAQLQVASMLQDPSPFAPPGYVRKRRSVALALALTVGFIGGHRFYLGYTSTGVSMLAIALIGWYFCHVGPVITVLWALYDVTNIFAGKLSDANGYELD